MAFFGLWFVWFVFWYMVRVESAPFSFALLKTVRPYPSPKPWHGKAPLTCFKMPIDDSCSRGTVRSCRQYCEEDCPSYLLAELPPLSARQVFVARWNGDAGAEDDAMLSQGHPSAERTNEGGFGHGHLNEHGQVEHDSPLPKSTTHMVSLSTSSLAIEQMLDVSAVPVLVAEPTSSIRAARPDGFLL